MQLVASVALVVIGVLLALVFDVASDLRAFGWVIVAIGLLGLVAWWWLLKQRRSSRS